jgi:hypothetical protein
MKLNSLWPLCLGTLLLTTTVPAHAATLVPLNTGYNHAFFAPYPVVPTTVSTTNDNYWINITSYPNTSPVAPAASWVLKTPTGWLPPGPGSHWINSRPAAISPGSPQDPGYSIFRKCFCLLPNYREAAMRFNLRADDNVQVWVNSVLNVAVPPNSGRWSWGTPIVSNPSQPSWFRAGRNCVYVLVENTSQHMGFTMDGSFTAEGLMPLPAVGPDMKFDCGCNSGVPGPANTAANMVQEERVVIEAISAIAKRRAASKSFIPPPANVRRPVLNDFK